MDCDPRTKSGRLSMRPWFQPERTQFWGYPYVPRGQTGELSIGFIRGISEENHKGVSRLRFEMDVITQKPSQLARRDRELLAASASVWAGRPGGQHIAGGYPPGNRRPRGRPGSGPWLKSVSSECGSTSVSSWPTPGFDQAGNLPDVVRRWYKPIRKTRVRSGPPASATGFERWLGRQA